nr:hypothetical protein [Tanacetum cinerariifolium]
GKKALLQICSRVFLIEDLEKLQNSILETICKLEKIFSPGFFNSMELLVVHLVWVALLGGPMQYRWMYLYERKMGSLKRTNRNTLKSVPRDFTLSIHFSSPTDTRLNIFKVPSRSKVVDVEKFFQENEMPTCSNKTDANENTKIISFVTLREIKKVGDLDVGDAYMDVSENEEEFVDTYDNLEVRKAEEEFIDTYDDSDDDNELALSDHSFDEDEVNLSNHSLNDYGGRGRGISGNIVIGGTSHVSGFSNQEDENYDNGSKSEGRGRGITRNISIGGGSNVSGFRNQDVYYDNGNISGEKKRGESGNIGGRGSSSTSG